MVQKPPLQNLRPDQYHNPTISDDQIYRIGHVIVSFSKLEAALEDTIWFFLDLDIDIGRIITARLGADARITMLRALAPSRITDENLLKKFRKLLGHIDELKEARNFIAHGVWGTLMPDDIPVALSLKPKTASDEIVSETFSKERMDAIDTGIQSMAQSLFDLPEALGAPRRVPREQPRP